MCIRQRKPSECDFKICSVVHVNLPIWNRARANWRAHHAQTKGACTCYICADPQLTELWLRMSKSMHDLETHGTHPRPHSTDRAALHCSRQQRQHLRHAISATAAGHLAALACGSRRCPKAAPRSRCGEAGCAAASGSCCRGCACRLCAARPAPVRAARCAAQQSARSASSAAAGEPPRADRHAARVQGVRDTPPTDPHNRRPTLYPHTCYYF